MKIKQLHIRNIASLERGDIDFENGLCEAGCNSPASLFLISGDTGAGKTTILDCISMCLYGTTPRVESVANKKTNTFTTNDGEALNIYSLEQYTRHGISPKDECYCELEFEGNDGRQYISRMELGMKGTRNKGGVFHHRDAQLILICEGVELTRKKQEATNLIRQAVGLTFEQFSRISMLAQGQFQNFLVGDKKEREAILEQLTNTERYSLYGKAISRICKKYKSEYDTLATLCKEQAGDLIPEDKRSEKSLIKDFLANEYLIICKERDSLLEKLNTLTNLHEGATHAEEETKQLECLRKAEAEPPYSTARQYIARWQATEQQRRWLDEKNQAERKLRNAKKEIEGCNTLYASLNAYFQKQLSDLEKEKEKLMDINSAIKEHRPTEHLYSHIGETGELLRQFMTTRDIISRLQSEIESSKEAIPQLTKAKEETARVAEEERRRVKELQDKINDLSVKLEEMNPREITASLEKASEKDKIISDLIKGIISLEDKKTITLQKEKEAEELAKTLADLQEEADKANQKRNEARLKKENSTARLENMAVSTSKYLKELRARLADEKADRCPLCGQAIKHLIIDEELEAILLPLRREKEEAQKNFETSESHFQECKAKASHTEGALTTLLSSLAKSKEEEEATNRLIMENAAAAGADTDNPLLPQLRAKGEETVSRIKQLRKQLADTQALQKDINSLIKALKPLDRAVAEKEKEEKAAEKKLETHLSSLKNKEEQREQQILTLSETEKKCDLLLSIHYPGWKENPNEIQKTISAKVADYENLCKKRDKLERDIHDHDTLIENISSIRDTIAKNYDSTSLPAEEKKEEYHDILAEWNNLSSSEATARRNEAEALEILKAREESLNEYYAESGDTEEELRRLINSPLNFSECYELWHKLQMRIASLEHSLKEWEEKLKEYEKSEGLEPGTPLPDPGPLRDKYEAMQRKAEENRTAFGQLEGELKKDDEARLRLTARLEEMNAARITSEKWERIDSRFGGTRLRTLVQTHILKPLLDNANIYLSRITDQYTLTCSDRNENLSILVLDRYNKNQVRSATVLSGGERFMISLALSLALSSLNKGSLNVDILFIDEGFGTLDEKSLDSVMNTLERLQEMAGQTRRRVGVISHREELEERIPVQIQVKKRGDGRSRLSIVN